MDARLASLISLVGRAFEYALDTVAPQDPFIRSIERMTHAEFAAAAAPSSLSIEAKDTIAFFSYRDPLVKAALLEVKSYGNKKIARLLGRAARERLVEELSELSVWRNFTSPLLVPIPLTRRSLRKRGWNQCETIAREMALWDRGASFELRPELLAKRLETADQVGKSRAERFANLKGCFVVPVPTAVKGKNVLVFDDVVTTGATLLEARKTLLRAGAKKAICVALCH